MKIKLLRVFVFREKNIAIFYFLQCNILRLSFCNEYSIYQHFSYLYPHIFDAALRRKLVVFVSVLLPTSFFRDYLLSMKQSVST